MRMLYRVQLQKAGTEFTMLNKYLSSIKYEVPKSELDQFTYILHEKFLPSLSDMTGFYGLFDTYVEQINKLLKESTTSRSSLSKNNVINL